ncbi:hypothetical protein BCU68_08695 [Vibrio sp. 10N.286.49.B3]|uniref:hypothetical protein n=1 Tax=Vibrio sp. 10N.286.49.B3 TaxID=1880855 RepID=UPI000C83C38D|nr:hypothetical protein [Vibrio sp. 10N.286.49.B3]PMH46140.1 hypothetical protein BCU68_08695 [Vibrio sp. 10N.286.49.B3]
MLWESSNVINKIRQTLDTQSKNKITESSKQKERDNLVTWYNKQLRELEEKNSNVNDISNQIGELRVLINEIRSTSQTSDVTEVPVASGFFTSNKNVLGLTISLLFILTFGVIALNSNEQTLEITHTEPYNANSTSNIQAWEEVPEDEVKLTLLQDVWPPENTISSKDALQYVGTSQIICGLISQVSPFSKGVYLNFDKPYPDSTFNSIIWDSDLDYVMNGSSDYITYENKPVCVSGDVTIYNGRAQVILNDPTQFKVF